MRFSPRALTSLACAAMLLAVAEAEAQGFRALHAEDATDVMAVGDNGEVYRTLDGGNSWFESILGSPSSTLRDVAGRGFVRVVVGDGGAIWLSTDSGGHWALTTAPGSPSLRAVAMPSDQTWYAAGGGGTLLKTTDAGANWSALTSGTAATLNALRFTDALNGWAAGDGGTLLVTADGGSSWTPVSLGTPNALLSVDQQGSAVWVVGAEGAAFRSTDSGANFAGVNLELDARSDVRVVHMRSADTLWIAGGGGFIRQSVNGGATWTFPQHRMHAPITDLTSFGARVWTCASKHRVVMTSNDHGATWQFPAGATLAYVWADTVAAFGGQLRGSTFAINPVYKSTMYCALGQYIMRSRNDGESWKVAAQFPSGFSKCNAFMVSPKDSAVWLAACSGGSVADRLLRTANSGAKWDTVLTHDFGEYGIPLEMDPDRPDTVYFGGELGGNGTPPSALMRSTNFGQTWTSLPPTFRSPCDLVVVPDTAGVIIVADGVTGSGHGKRYKSTDGGQTFVLIDSSSVASEIPGLANSRLRPGQILSTAWAFGGVQRSTNYGDSFPTVNDTTAQPWGIDVCKEDPNVVMFGQYSAYPAIFTYLSLDGGVHYLAIPTPSYFDNNYSFLVRDRSTMLAEQGGSGIWKLRFNYAYTPSAGAQSLTVTAPNGGESWTQGTVHKMQWNAANVAMARVEYRSTPGDPWQHVADVPGYRGSFGWTIPWDPTTHAQVRVYDAWDAAPRDSSDAEFTILAPRIAETPATLDLGTINSGDAAVLPLTLSNDGTASLDVTSISTATAAFAVGRTSLTLAPGLQDTVGVWFLPTYGGVFDDTVTIVSGDTPRSPIRVPVTGTAIGPMVRLIAPNGGESWPFASVQSISWWDTLVTTVDLDYRVSADSAWVGIAQGVPSVPPQYEWTIPFAPTPSAEVRVRNASGPPSDASDVVFVLAAPEFAVAPDTVPLPPSVQYQTVAGVVTVANAGNGPLAVSSVTVDKPEFWVGRTSFEVAAAGSDTVEVFYAAEDAGSDSAVVTITANGPFSPHQVTVQGNVVVSTAVGTEGSFAFALLQNRPNPFSRNTVIQYALARDAEVSLDVFDIRGQRVAMLASGRQPAGIHHVSLSRSARGGRTGLLPAGVYFYRLRAGGFVATRRMLLVP